MKKLLFSFVLSAMAASTISSQELITDIRTGMDGSEPQYSNAVQKDGNLYFIATADITQALYKTDGTSGGTQKIVGEGTDFFATYLLDFIGDELLFWGGNFTDGSALYKTDVTGSYTLLKTFSTQLFGSYLTPFIKVGSTIYFIANDEVSGYELWKTDGTAAGTVMVKDINPGSESGFMSTGFATVGNTIFFNAGNPTYGAELWKSDGTEVGTVMVKDIEPNNSLGHYYYGSNPAYLTAMNGKVYFSAYRALDGRELWVSDGTEGGTQLVKDLVSGDTSPSELTVFNNHLYFTGYHSEGLVLYKTDGTNAGTNPVKLPSQGGAQVESKLTIFKNKLAFLGFDNSYNSNVWTSDGTTNGTTKIAHGSSSFSFFYGSHLLPTANHLYFYGMDNAGTGNTQLYRIADGNNTIFSVTAPSFVVNDIEPPLLFNNCVTLVGDNGNTGYEPYKICNATVGIEEEMAGTNLEIRVYPNPTTDKLYVESKNNEKYTVNIHSAIGQKLVEQEFTGKTILDVEKLSAGVYIVDIQHLNGSKTIRIVKE